MRVSATLVVFILLASPASAQWTYRDPDAPRTTTFRQIFLDSHTLANDPQPTWMGYSKGRWEGDTLVVETSGFNGRTCTSRPLGELCDWLASALSAFERSK